MFLNYKSILGPLIVLAILLVLLVRSCEQEPKIITKTKVEYIQVTDTIIKTEIQEKPTIKYITRIEREKGRDSIVYIERPTPTSVQANEYQTKLVADSSHANLKILVQGELLKVEGTISHLNKYTTTETIKVKPKSGLFLSGSTSLSKPFEDFGVHLDYQFKNSVLIGTSVNYNNHNKALTPSIKLGIKIL